MGHGTVRSMGGRDGETLTSRCVRVAAASSAVSGVVMHGPLLGACGGADGGEVVVHSSSKLLQLGDVEWRGGLVFRAGALCSAAWRGEGELAVMPLAM